MRSSRHLASLALLTTLALTGCGGSDGGSDDDGAKDAPSPTSTIAPADGDTVEGEGYSFSAPKGWTEPDETIPGTEQADVFVADTGDTDGFADNINVIRIDPAPLEDLGALEKALKSELEGIDAKDVTIRDRAEIAGDEAAHLASVLTQQGTTYQTEQYNAIHDGVSYVVTFSYSTDVSEADRDENAAAVLASWKWAA